MDVSQTLAAAIERIGQQTTTHITGLHGSAVSLFLARLCKEQKRTICCLVSNDESLEALAQDIRLFTDTDILVYPSFEIPPYTPLSPDPETVARRISTLYRLLENAGPAILVTSCEAALRRIPPKAALGSNSEIIIAGEDTDRDRLVETLINMGYQHTAMVQQLGDISVRGSLLDIFPPSTVDSFAKPVRIDFFGDTVESIRLFDPLTQRSTDMLEEAVILPCSDILFPDSPAVWKAKMEELFKRWEIAPRQAREVGEQLFEQIRFQGIEFFLPLIYPEPAPPQTIFDYLPANSLLVQLEPHDLTIRTKLVRERIDANYQEALQGQVAALPPGSLFMDQEEFDDLARNHQTISLAILPDPDHSDSLSVPTGDHSLLQQEINLFGKKRGILAPLADRLKDWLGHRERVILACKSERHARHFGEMLQRYQMVTETVALPLDLEAKSVNADIQLVVHPLSTGFDLPSEKLHILSAAELFGDRRLLPSKGKSSRQSDAPPVQTEQLATGDFVVHKDHGIGIFQGLVNMHVGGRHGDFLLIEYQGDDKLYVPVDHLHWVSRYQGLTDRAPKVDRLGSENWKSAKKKVTDAVWKVANELIEIYAKRAIREGTRFSRPGELYEELEQSFPYEETPGQDKAITELIDDLCNDRPTDRLVCGDVGYGKTEVAVRGAFKVIEDGFQVAVLVPTTVLAEQHAATFGERYANLPVRVGCLNRFRSTGEQKKLVTALAAGEIDLVVGTHRLLSKDVRFKKLGLLIIDEEHRFGVAHKEKIKKLKAEVDVLTLTATPIPRTLQMSLLGIRDLSVISTPPQRRRAVKTFLARKEDLVIREAIIREMQRGGQVFFVHNRVRSIHRLAEKITGLVPNARLGVAHGQMPGKELEEIMVKFINHEIDVLLCTTIIESGLDISNANTIIINRADQLGLADIYQLRGRVGRSSRQSYAYLLVPSLESLTSDAKQRLRALMDCNELGAGFKLAMNDLQIRGGGNLLGVSQSGHIAAVGYDLYLELLQSTVAELQKKATQSPEDRPPIDPEIKLNIAAFLPDDYISDPSQRYHMYRRLSLAGTNSREELDDLRQEIEDRFGTLPRQADTLFRMVELKFPLQHLGIDKLEQAPQALVFTFNQQSRVDPATLLQLVGKKTAGKKTGLRFTPDNRLIVPLQEQEDLFSRIHTILERLSAS